MEAVKRLRNFILGRFWVFLLIIVSYVPINLKQYLSLLSALNQIIERRALGLSSGLKSSEEL